MTGVSQCFFMFLSFTLCVYEYMGFMCFFLHLLKHSKKCALGVNFLSLFSILVFLTPNKIYDPRVLKKIKFFKSKSITIYMKNTHINKYKMFKVYCTKK